MTYFKEMMIEGCQNCEDQTSEMLLDHCGIKCSSCGVHRCLVGE